LRLVALIVAVICVLALAASAFVLSYPGARDTALTAGVTPKLARIYPGLFDAVLLVACADAWLAILVVTAAIATADATHAMSVTLPKRPMEAVVAAVPWAVLLIGFTLLYAIARQGKAARVAAPATAPSADTLTPRGSGGTPNGGNTVPLSELLVVTNGSRSQPATAVKTPPAIEPAPPAKPAAAADPSTEPTTDPAASKDRPAKRGRKARKDQAASEPAASQPIATPLATSQPAATPPPPFPNPAAPLKRLPVAAIAPQPTATPETTVTPEPTALPEAAIVPETTAAPDASALATTEDAAADTTDAAVSTSAPQVADADGLPELPRRRSVFRDEPSDADAEAFDPGVHFNRFHSSPTPPSD
jgi:hypothetical protein